MGLTEMEFCGVHFPADPANPALPQIKAKLDAAGVIVPCFGVEGFTDDGAANGNKFAFARAVGAEILSADPTPEAFASLEALCEEFQIKIAIHNHGPGTRYDGVADTLEAVEGRMHVHDWHATIMHLLGFDHERLTFPYAGRDFRLTDVHGSVAKDILA